MFSRKKHQFSGIFSSLARFFPVDVPSTDLLGIPRGWESLPDGFSRQLAASYFDFAVRRNGTPPLETCSSWTRPAQRLPSPYVGGLLPSYSTYSASPSSIWGLDV